MDKWTPHKATIVWAAVIIVGVVVIHHWWLRRSEASA